MILSRSPKETFDLGVSFARKLKPGDVIALAGDLGTGKTWFVAGACSGLGVRSHVGSPTFTIIHEYSTPLALIVHIDLYRIASKLELDQLGIEEYLTGQCICFIEWPELCLNLLPGRYYQVLFRHGESEEERSIAIEEVHGVAA